MYADTRDMLAGHPAVSRIHTIDREWKRQGLLLQARREAALVSQLRERRYQLIVHLTDHWRGAWLVQLLRPRWSVAPARARLALEGLLLAPLRPAARHAPPHGGIEPRRPSPHGAVSDARTRSAWSWCPAPRRKRRWMPSSRSTASPPKGFLQVHPTSRWLFKAWTDERNAELLQRLARDGHRLVLTGAPNAREQAIAKRILERAGVAVTDLSGALTLREMGALAARARLFFGVDSAPMHIAAAMGTPVVALFGPSGEHQWGPWMVAQRIVTSGHACRPCGNDGCGGSKVSECLTGLPVDRVHAAINELLAQP